MKYLFLTSQLLIKALLGIMFLFLLFIFCIIVVLGAKLLLIYVKSKFVKPAPPPAKKPKAERKAVKSIEIDPNEDTKIIFKKTS